MAHPQSSPRGVLSRATINVGSQTLTGNSTGLKVSGGLALSGKTTNFVTQNTTGLKLPQSLALSGQTAKYLAQDATGSVVVPTFSTKPAYRKVGGICFVSNGTGKMIAFHSTGTTWVYASKTSVLA